MKDYDHIGDDRIIDYILGRLTSQEESEIDNYLLDEAFYERICAAQDDLIDEYARGALSEDIRQLVETRLLSNQELNDQASFTKDLLRLASEVRDDEQLALAINDATHLPKLANEISDNQIVDYILGISNESESALIEEALSDEQFFDRLLWVENDLIDDYASGQVSTNSRVLIEQRLLSNPVGQQTLFESRTLYALTRSLRNEQKARMEITSWRERLTRLFTFSMPTLELALSCAVVLLAASSFWGIYLFTQYREQSNELFTLKDRTAQLDKEKDVILADSMESRSEIDRLRSEIARIESESFPPPFAVTIGSGSAPRSRGILGGRGESSDDVKIIIKRPITLNIKSKADAALLSIVMTDDANQSYQVTIRRPESDISVLTMNSIKMTRESEIAKLKIVFPASMLDNGKYRLTIIGNNNSQIWEFSLNVTKLQ